MRISHVIPVFLVLAVLFNQQANGQKLMADTMFYRQMVEKAMSSYIHAVGETRLLYNGSEYTASYPKSNGHAFFEYDRLQAGSIVYDGILYNDVYLSYDLVANEIIVHRFEQGYPFKLVNDKISRFSILDHSFLQLSEAGMPVGFYEILYDGSVQVYVHRRKQPVQGLNVDDRTTFVSYDNYYVRNKGVYHAVNNRNSLVAAFADRKDDIRKFMRSNKINVNQANAIITTAKEYDRLTK